MEEKAYAEEQGKLILSIAKGIWNKKYKQFPNDKDDAIGLASLEMYKSIKRYDSKKNISLNSYLNLIADRSFKKYFRDFVYKHQDKYTYIEQESEEGYILGLEDIIGAVDVNYNGIEFKELMEKFDRNIGERNKHTSRKMNINELHTIIELLDKGYTQVEVSKMFGCSQNTVKKKIHRMREVIMEIKNNE
ncbi:MAG: helix-turn-helix domain-containing protein [Clostridia bacterium]